MKKLLCKIFGHDYKYNSHSLPTKCLCKRCDKKWRTIKNPKYNGRNLMEEGIFIWESYE
jgi:hypothetical protein